MDWPERKEVKLFYGNPDTNADGRPDVVWEGQNIVGIKSPYAMFLAWDPDRPVSKIRVHRKCADSLRRVLEGISELGPEFIQEHELDYYGGAYNFRMTRGGATLSMHSYGAAIDLSPRLNPWRKKWTGSPMMPQEVVDLFEAEGWVFGGRWQTADAMHFQAAI